MTKEICNTYFDTTADVTYTIDNTARNEWTIYALVDYLGEKRTFEHKTSDELLIESIAFASPSFAQELMDMQMFPAIFESVDLFAQHVFENEEEECEACENGMQWDEYNDKDVICERCDGTGSCTYYANYSNK